MKKTKKWFLIPIGIVLLLLLFFWLRSRQTRPYGQELLENGSFADVQEDGVPSAWYTQAYIQSEGYTDFSVVQAGQGQALHIANYMANDARIAQDVAVEPNSFYCLSGQICAQAQGGRGANLSIADVYAFSAGIYDSQGEWRQVELYGQTGPRQRSLTVYARLGGYSGETSGEAWFTNLSLKKVESLPAGVEVTLFYQPSYSAETKTFSLDLRHLLLAVLVLLYGLMACQCYCFKSVLGLLMLSLGVAALSLLCRGASDTQQTQNAMPYVPYIVYGLLLATLAIALFLAHRLARRGEAVPFFCGRQAQTPPAGVFMQDEQANHQRSRRADAKDAALMLGITVLYALLAYYHLGSTVSPQTSFIFRQASETVVFDLCEAQDDFRMLYMEGINDGNNSFTVQTSEDGESWGTPISCATNGGTMFQWFYVNGYNAVDARSLRGRYVLLTASAPGLSLLETVFRTADGTPLPVTAVDSAGRDASALVDEPDTLSGEPSWYNGMYFDEIYHARTGYEHSHGLQPYEISHPPLGKVMMSWAISIFGMTPFGWRFAGALAGVLMLPGMYLLGKLLTKRRMGAFAAMFLMAVDCMHFTQTRIATIDSFVVLFIIWSYVFMVYYLRMDYWRKPLIKTLIPLALSGLFMGLAVASKWTGCYAGVGLAVLFFWSVWRRSREHLAASHELEAYEASQQKVNHKLRKPHPEESKLAVPARTYPARLLITLGCCLVFFIAVPLGVYYASYIPYFLPSGGITVQKVIQAAVGDYLTTGVFGGMFGYHSTPGLGMNHPFYSPWYEWPVIGKPMWYYSASYHAEGSTQTIMALGNPAVWWGGLAALIMVIVIWAERHIDRRGLYWQSRGDDMRPAILLISFAAQYMPWVLVPRGTYIYHYFAAVPFIILCVALCFDLLADTAESYAEMPAIAARPRLSASLRRAPAGLMIVYLAIALALFIAFFPYASGVTASTKWLSAMQWFKGWLYY